MEAAMDSRPSGMHDFWRSDDPQTVHVLRPTHWVPIWVLVAIALAAVGFLLFGRIPVTVEGNAMFLTPGTIVSFQSTASGRIVKWHVKVGDHVQKGQLLAELDQPLIAKQLDQAVAQLADIDTKNKTITAYTSVYTDLENAAIARKRETLTSRIGELAKEIARSKEILDKVYVRKEAYLSQQAKDLAAVRALNDKRTRQMEEKLAVTEKLFAENLRSADDVLADRRQLLAQQDRNATLDLQLLQATLDKAKAAEQRLDAANRITEQEQQVSDLRHLLEMQLGQQAQLEEQFKTELFRMDSEASDIQRTIDRYRRQLTEKREIRSDYDGRILELTAGEGKIISEGVDLGSIDTAVSGAELRAVAYFKLKDGKKIKPGMTIRLIPATVEKERFGGVIAAVRSVSDYSVTADGVARTVGNSGVAALLTAEECEVEVFADLVKDPETASGFQWERFGGPKTALTSGTVGTALVNIQEPAPLAFVIPILGNWSGL